MKKKDAAVLKVLAELGINKAPEITAADEERLKYATDSEYRFLQDMKELYNPTTEESPE